jgi:hypothetical protein
MPTTERNSWVLCKAHCKCKKCQKTLQSYKTKANKHAFNASRLKYALMCFLEEDTLSHVGYNPPPTGEVQLVPIEEDPVFTPQEDLTIEKQQKDNELYRCGICEENMVKVGKRKPIIYQCGHSNCAECFNGWCASKHAQGDEVQCPYCRAVITKAIRLFTST